MVPDPMDLLRSVVRCGCYELHDEGQLRQEAARERERDGERLVPAPVPRKNRLGSGAIEPTPGPLGAGGMKFTTQLKEPDVRSMLEALAVGEGTKRAQSTDMCRVSVPVQLLSKRKALGRLGLTYYVSTGNIMITAPATELDNMRNRVIELEQR